MKTAKHYNNFQDQNKLPNLKPGETAIFEVLGIRPNPIEKDKLLIPAAVSVPSTDTVVDPVSGELVDIAAIDAVSGDGGVRFSTIWFNDYNAGLIMLSGNSVSDRELYQYLKLCNYNESNPSRDISRPAIFRERNKAAEAGQKRSQRNLAIDAVNYARSLDAISIKEFVAAIGGNYNESMEVMRSTVEDFAWSKPDKFMSLATSESIKIKAKLREAEKAGIIKFTITTSQWMWSDSKEVICTVSRTSGVAPIEDLCAFIETESKGNAVYGTIENMLAASNGSTDEFAGSEEKPKQSKRSRRGGSLLESTEPSDSE